MRKIIAAVLLVLMLLGFAVAQAEEDPNIALVHEAAEKALEELLQTDDLGGWSQLILTHAEIKEVTLKKKTYNVVVEVPTLKSGASGSTSDEAYLSRAFTPYLTFEPTTELLLSATVKDNDDGTKTLKWLNNTPKNLLNKVKNLANKAKQSYTTNNVRVAIDRYLLPTAANMPKSKPRETVPEIGTLPAYTSAVAAELGITEQQAAQRLPALMMLMNITRFTANDTLSEAEVTVTIKDWKTMLLNAFNYAKEAMATMVGVPEMSRAELEELMCSYLPQALVDVYYTQRGQVSEKMTIDLAAAVSEGVQGADGLMDFYRTYNSEVDVYVSTLKMHASTLAYYPRVELIDTGILSGDDHENGVSVSFDTGDSEVNHGYVCVMQKGQIVLEGFVHNGVRLMVRLQPGAYQVYCSVGPEWFGTEHLCGRDGYFGTFELQVERGTKSIIHMEDAGGNLAVTDLTEAEFHAAIGK